jgi:hypothetical protein
VTIVVVHAKAALIPAARNTVAKTNFFVIIFPPLSYNLLSLPLLFPNSFLSMMCGISGSPAFNQVAGQKFLQFVCSDALLRSQSVCLTPDCLLEKVPYHSRD